MYNYNFRVRHWSTPINNRSEPFDKNRLFFLDMEPKCILFCSLLNRFRARCMIYLVMRSQCLNLPEICSKYLNNTILQYQLRRWRWITQTNNHLVNVGRDSLRDSLTSSDIRQSYKTFLSNKPHRTAPRYVFDFSCFWYV